MIMSQELKLAPESAKPPATERTDSKNMNTDSQIGILPEPAQQGSSGICTGMTRHFSCPDVFVCFC
jgi:hypothetical protein